MFLTKNIEKPKVFASILGANQAGTPPPDSAGWSADSAGWPPGGRRVAAGLWVPIWGRCLFGGCAEAETKQVRTPRSRASFVWGKI